MEIIQFKIKKRKNSKTQLEKVKSSFYSGKKLLSVRGNLHSLGEFINVTQKMD